MSDKRKFAWLDVPTFPLGGDLGSEHLKILILEKFSSSSNRLLSNACIQKRPKKVSKISSLTRETFSLVGESGSGKTTIGRAIIGFE